MNRRRHRYGRFGVEMAPSEDLPAGWNDPAPVMRMPEMDIFGQTPPPVIEISGARYIDMRPKTNPLVYVGIGLVAVAAYLALK